MIDGISQGRCGRDMLLRKLFDIGGLGLVEDSPDAPIALRLSDNSLFHPANQGKFMDPGALGDFLRRIAGSVLHLYQVYVNICRCKP